MLRRVILLHRNVIFSCFCLITILVVYCFHKEFANLSRRTTQIEMELSRLSASSSRGACACACDGARRSRQKEIVNILLNRNRNDALLLRPFDVVDAESTTDNRKEGGRVETRSSTSSSLDSSAAARSQLQKNDGRGYVSGYGYVNGYDDENVDTDAESTRKRRLGEDSVGYFQFLVESKRKTETLDQTDCEISRASEMSAATVGKYDSESEKERQKESKELYETKKLGENDSSFNQRSVSYEADMNVKDELTDDTTSVREASKFAQQLKLTETREVELQVQQEQKALESAVSLINEAKKRKNITRRTRATLNMLYADLEAEEEMEIASDSSWKSTSDNEWTSKTKETEVIIYNRIPKTGSTTFAGLLYDLCETNGFRVIHMNITKNWQTLSVHDQYKFVKNVSHWNEVKPVLYHGHFSFIPFEKFGSNIVPLYINLLRDPLERLISYYYFLRNGDYTFTKKRKRSGDNTTFDECVEMNGTDCDPSLLWKQVAYFCGHTADCRQPSRWALQKAKRTLVERYFLVGVLAEFEDFLKVLQTSVPSYFAGIVQLYESNTGEKKRLRQTINKLAVLDATRERFKQSKVWQLEQDFYEFARQLFHDTKQRLFETSVVNGANLTESQRLVTLRVNEFRFEKIKPPIRKKRVKKTAKDFN